MSREGLCLPMFMGYTVSDWHLSTCLRSGECHGSLPRSITSTPQFLTTLIPLNRLSIHPKKTKTKQLLKMYITYCARNVLWNHEKIGCVSALSSLQSGVLLSWGPLELKCSFLNNWIRSKGGTVEGLRKNKRVQRPMPPFILISWILKNLGFTIISWRTITSIQLICIIYFDINMYHIMIYVLWIDNQSRGLATVTMVTLVRINWRTSGSENPELLV